MVSNCAAPGELDREPRPERVVGFDDRDVEVGSLDARSATVA